MKKLLLLMLCTTLLASCNINVKNDDGPQVTSVRHTRPFDSIEMNSACDVKYVQGDSFGVNVVGGENAVKEVTTEFDGTTLKIGTQKTIAQLNFGMHRTMPTIYVTSPDLIGVRIHGAGNFEVEKPLDTDTLRVFLKGVGNIELSRVICDQLYVTLLGTGNVEIDDITSQYTDVLLKGVGNVDIGFNHSGNVNCTLQGVGDITLSGTAKQLSKTVKGSGSIDTDKLTINP